jgi:hypothetical protein
VVESTCCGVILVEVAFSTSFADRSPTIVSATPEGESSPPSHLDCSQEDLGAVAGNHVVFEEMHQILWYTSQTGICTRGVALTPRSNSPTKSRLREVNKRSPLDYQDRTNTPAGCIATSIWAPCTSLLVLCHCVRLSPADQLKRPLSRRRNLCHAHCSIEQDASHHGIKSSAQVAYKTWLKPGNRA